MAQPALICIALLFMWVSAAISVMDRDLLHRVRAKETLERTGSRNSKPPAGLQIPGLNILDGVSLETRLKKTTEDKLISPASVIKDTFTMRKGSLLQVADDPDPLNMTYTAHWFESADDSESLLREPLEVVLAEKKKEKKREGNRHRRLREP